MAKIFDTPFALNGDREAIPAGSQANGRVSFNQGFTLDYEKNLLTDPAAKDIERKKLNYLFFTICNAINKLQEDGGGVIGVPIPYPSLNVPVGYAPYDGRRFDTIANPVLASLFPNGYLPDIRGVVLRALDAGRGLDPDRGILTYQEDCIQNITGQAPLGDSNGQFEAIWAGAFYSTYNYGRKPGSAKIDHDNPLVMFDASRVVRTGPEVRMKNMAFYYITKVG